MHRTFAKNQKHNTMKNTNNNSDCKNSNVSGLISQAIQKQDAALIREFINTKWDKSTPVYPVVIGNLKCSKFGNKSTVFQEDKYLSLW